MEKHTCKERLLTRSIRISPSLSNAYKRAGINLSGLARRMLEEYAEIHKINLKKKEEQNEQL